MKVFICGGGSGEQTRRAIRRLNEVIRHDLPCLYIPLAMEEEQYDSCYEWITGELSGVEIPGIEMIRSAEELSRKRLADYSFLFIGGGNTFKLLNDIKRAGMFEPIRDYLQHGGTAFGGSAGAIIFGEDLESCALDDDNEVGLKDTEGFDVLGGVSFLCHYTNRSPEKDQRSEEYLLKISGHRKTYALPEEDTLFLNEDRLEEISDRPYYIFENHRKTKIMTDFSTLTACGECCTGCPKKADGRCPGCIEADGRVPEWSESGRCRIHACTREHHVQFCGLCEAFPCSKLPELVSWNPGITERMTSLRDEYLAKTLPRLSR